MAESRPLAQKVWSIIEAASTLQFILTLGGSASLTGVLAKVASVNGWLDGPYLVVTAFGVFCMLTAAFLATVPRLWTPKGPFGSNFGSAALMMGRNEETNRRVFERAPRLRLECRAVAKKLREFVEKEEKNQPQAPANTTEGSVELNRFNAETQAFLQRFNALYRNAWHSRVEALLLDARAMFFGPVPVTTSRFMAATLSPPEVHRLALALDRLSQSIPSTYSDAFHEARVERLRRLRQDGLGLAADIGQFIIERHQAAVSLQQQPGVVSDPAEEESTPRTTIGDAHSQWQQGVNLSGKTEALFAARFGGTLLRVVQELEAFGLSDENLERTLSWGMTLRISSYDLPGLAGVISSLCQRIPYD